MTQRIGLFVGLVFALTGCLGDESTRSQFQGVPVETPPLSPASLASAARVDQVGHQLLTQNPFLGVTPTFHALGKSEPEIFHRDTTGVFLTDGLIQRCGNDEELAAVLASELGKMIASRRIADRMRLPDVVPPTQDASAQNANGAGSDLNQIGVQAIFDQQIRRTEGKRPNASEDPNVIATNILKSAGIDTKYLDSVRPYLDDAARHSAMAQHFGVKGNSPQWSK